MAGHMSFEGGIFEIVKDGVIRVNTSRKLTALVPGSALVLTNQNISFPDLWSGTLYEQWTQPASFPPGATDYGCSTWRAPIEQEWGPDKAAPNTIADVVLGTVSSGFNYLDVFVNLTRTVTPNGWLDMPMASPLPQGQWVQLEGGSCEIEASGPFRRLFDIRLVGTSVILRRRQSVSKNGPKVRVNPSDQTGDYTYFQPGTNAGVDNTKFAWYGPKIDQKGFDQNENHRPHGQNPCSSSHAGLSFASNWNGSLTIVPGVA